MTTVTDGLGDRVGILQTLTIEHQVLAHLVDRLVQSAYRGEEQRSRELLALVQRHFVLHRQCEEIEFYSLLSEIERCRAWVNHSRATHQEILDILVELFATSAHNLGWTTLVICLRDAIHDHIAHEEGELFTRAQDMLSPHALRDLDAHYAERRQIVSTLLDALRPEGPTAAPLAG